MTLKEWKSRLQVGVQLRCSFRHYAPDANEVIVIQKVQSNAIAFGYGGQSGSIKIKAGELVWMDFPKKDGVRFIADGFELLKPDGSVASRYHWIKP